jgi:hypothetical protein
METNVSEAWAKVEGLEVLDEPTHRGDGTPLPQTRRTRRRKPKTSVSKEAAKKKAGGNTSAPTAEEATE